MGRGDINISTHYGVSILSSVIDTCRLANDTMITYYKNDVVDEWIHK